MGKAEFKHETWNINDLLERENSIQKYISSLTVYILFSENFEGKKKNRIYLNLLSRSIQRTWGKNFQLHLTQYCA